MLSNEQEGKKSNGAWSLNFNFFSSGIQNNSTLEFPLLKEKNSILDEHSIIILTCDLWTYRFIYFHKLILWNNSDWKWYFEIAIIQNNIFNHSLEK